MMPKPYKRKTDRGKTARITFQNASAAVKEGMSVRSAARNFGINRMTLQRYIDKLTNNPVPDINYENLTKSKKVFSADLETDLANHIKNLARQFHGLSKSKCLKLAYEFAKSNNLKRPESWDKNQEAGQDWWLQFKRRNQLAIRTPEATSRGRASAFNRHNANQFYSNLQEVVETHKFQPSQIYNTDETGCTTVQKPKKVVAQQGLKQLGSITAGERGELVTAVYTVRADGVALPPMLIFPRVNYKDFFIRGAPPGSVGVCTRTGWINEEQFLRYLEHIIEFSKCSKDNKILLILDNHESHVTLQAIDKAKDNGIIMLTIPPHTSHRLQPLDVGVFYSFKNAYNKVLDHFMRTYPDTSISIYDIPSFVNEAHLAAMTPRNITSGFRQTGIYPFNSNIYSDDDFAPAEVTDRPLPFDKNNSSASDNVHSSSDECLANEQQGTPTQEVASTKTINHQNEAASTSYIPPSEILPLPKAGPRKTNNQTAKRRGSTKILTNTPVRNEIATISKMREERCNKKCVVRKVLQEKVPSQKKKKQEKVSSSDSETDKDVQYMDSETDDDPNDDIMEGDFVIVKVMGKARGFQYIARVDLVEDEILTGVFLKRVTARNNDFPAFVINSEDEASFEKEDVIFKLPKPNVVGGTSRLSNQFTFPKMNLSKFELK